MPAGISDVLSSANLLKGHIYGGGILVNDKTIMKIKATPYNIIV